MTLKQVNDVLRRTEVGDEHEDPTVRLVALVCIMGTAIGHGRSPTNQQVARSMNAFEENFGKVTTENVDKFFGRLSQEIVSIDIPIDFITFAMG